MNKSQIAMVLHAGKFQHPFTKRKLIETHISYVILGSSFAYKFKKEIKYSFLDFSTLEKRKYYCQRELMLNNRFSKGVYLNVVPVHSQKGEISIGGTEGKIIDYAVKMKRLKEAKQMHLMLEKKEVTTKHIEALAVLIRRFHEGTDVIHKNFEQALFASKFNDILSVRDFIQTALGSSKAAMIKKAVDISDVFLQHHEDFFIRRIRNGNIRDCHGDLHSRNIFLYQKPILFDCIEFNDEFRQMDVLDELAFFCMDLEAEGYYMLSKTFTDRYFNADKKKFGGNEQLLFTYYKCYRANVRAKVNALRAMSAEEPLRKNRLDEVNKYLTLMQGYAAQLS